MQRDVSSAAELIVAISELNHIDEAHSINLVGYDESYIVQWAVDDLFGPTAFPVVLCDLTIHGNGHLITRAPGASPFRFFGVTAKAGRSDARLTLNNLALVNGNSANMGGGALVSDAPLLLNDCVLRNNMGSLGGAIYNGDGQSLTITRCVFTQNKATAKAGAVFNALASQLSITSSMFYENSAPNDGPSIWLSTDGQIRLHESSVQDAIILEQTSAANLELAPASGSASTPDELLNKALRQQTHVDFSRQQHATVKPSYPQPRWTPDGVPQVKELLRHFDEHQSLPPDALDALMAAGQSALVQDLVNGLRGKQDAIREQSGVIERTVDQVRRKLAFTPGLSYVKILLGFLSIQPGVDPAKIATLIAAGQSKEIQKALFELYAKNISGSAPDIPASPSESIFVDILGALVQEMVVRGVECTSNPITDFLAQERAPFYRSRELLWLPLALTNIEDELAAALPRLDASGGASWSMPYGWYGEEKDRRIATSELPIAVENTRANEHSLMLSAISEWPRYEAKAYVFEAPLSSDDITETLLLSLKLECLQNASKVYIRSTTPNHVLASLFSVACNGGAYTHGVGPANGRLKAWKSLAGLVGASPHDDVETVLSMAKQCQWLDFRADGDWFYNVAWDLGFAVLRPDGRSLAILAATDTD